MPSLSKLEQVLWLPFEENTGAKTFDLSRYRNNAVISGASWATGYSGKALSFDGTNDYLTIAHHATLDFGTSDFKIKFRAKPDYTNNVHMQVVSKTDDDHVADGYACSFRQGGVFWFQLDDNFGPELEYNLFPYTELTLDAGNPTMSTAYGCAEQCDFKLGAGSYCRWYRYNSDGVSDMRIGYATSADGITYTPSVSNPISFAPTIPDGKTYFPYVVKDGANYYMFLQNANNYKIYLFDVTNPVAPAVMNGGNPVLEPTDAWENGHIYNVAVAIVAGTYHMVYEADAGGGTFNIGYAHSTIAEMDFTSHKSASNPIFDLGSCPELVYVPDRAALLIIFDTYNRHMQGQIQGGYAYLASDLDDPDSWKVGKILLPAPDPPDPAGTYTHDSDPSIITSFNGTHPIMLSYGHAQNVIYQAYSTLTLTEFFDSIIVSDNTTWYKVEVNRTGNTATLLFNDVEVDSEDCSALNVSQPTLDLIIGDGAHYAGFDHEYYKGILDDLEIWKANTFLGIIEQAIANLENE